MPWLIKLSEKRIGLSRHSAKCCFLINRFLLIKHKAVQPVTARVPPLWINVKTRQTKWSLRGIIPIFMVIAMPTRRFMRCSHRIFISMKKVQDYVGGQFWDGRAKDLAEQAGGPPVNPVEMGMPAKKALIVERLKAESDLLQGYYGSLWRKHLGRYRQNLCHYGKSHCGVRKA